jgi:hypothetical protein
MSGLERQEANPAYNWQDAANCASADPELMFPDKGNHTASKMARQICANCDVIEFCLDDALKNPEPYGYRAGYSPKELRALRHKSRDEWETDRQAGLAEQAKQAHALRRDGASLQAIARKLGYASHGGVTYLLTHFNDEESS